MHQLLVAVLVAFVVAGCAEKPQRPLPKGEGSASYNNSDSGESRLRERTMSQGSSDRMAN